MGFVSLNALGIPNSDPERIIDQPSAGTDAPPTGPGTEWQLETDLASAVVFNWNEKTWKLSAVGGLTVTDYTEDAGIITIGETREIPFSINSGLPAPARVPASGPGPNFTDSGAEIHFVTEGQEVAVGDYIFAKPNPAPPDDGSAPEVWSEVPLTQKALIHYTGSVSVYRYSIVTRTPGHISFKLVLNLRIDLHADLIAMDDGWISSRRARFSEDAAGPLIPGPLTSLWFGHPEYGTEEIEMDVFPASGPVDGPNTVVLRNVGGDVPGYEGATAKWGLSICELRAVEYHASRDA